MVAELWNRFASVAIGSSSGSPVINEFPVTSERNLRCGRRWRTAALHGVGDDFAASKNAGTEVAAGHSEPHGWRHLAGDSHATPGAGAGPARTVGDAAPRWFAQSTADRRATRLDRGDCPS